MYRIPSTTKLNAQNRSDLLFRVALFVFISQLFGLTEYLREIMVLNLGWGNINPLRLYTVGLPALWVIHKCYKTRQFATPHLRLFLLLFLGFIFMESLPSRKTLPSYSFLDMIPLVGQLLGRPEPAYSFAMEQLYIYAYFLILVNFGLNRNCFYKVIDYSLVVGVLVCAVTYMGYVGLIDIGTDFRIQETILQTRPDTMVNPNHISHMCVFSILFLIIKQRYAKKFSRYYVLRDLLIILFLASMPIVNATRGAVINLLIVIPYYVFMTWRGSRDVIVKGILGAALFSFLLIVVPRVSETALGQRAKIYEEGTALRPVRIDNLTNTWSNFWNHPFIGVSYARAAKSDFAHGSRSNNQFAQLLAACGIFYFIIYLCYFFRFFAYKMVLLKRPEVLLSLLMVTSHSMLRRPMNVFPIFAYIAAHFYFCNNKDALCRRSLRS